MPSKNASECEHEWRLLENNTSVDMTGGGKDKWGEVSYNPIYYCVHCLSLTSDYFTHEDIHPSKNGQKTYESE